MYLFEGVHCAVMITSPWFWNEWERIQLASHHNLIEHPNFLQSIHGKGDYTIFQDFSGSPASAILSEILDLVEEQDYEFVNLTTRVTDLLQLKRDLLEYNHFTKIGEQTRYVSQVGQWTNIPQSDQEQFHEKYQIKEMTPSQLLSLLDYPDRSSSKTTRSVGDTLSLVSLTPESRPTGMIVGTLNQYKDERFVQVDSLIVKAEHRGRGIAQNLVSNFAKKALDRGYTYATTILSKNSEYLADIFSLTPLQSKKHYALDPTYPDRE